MHVRIKSNNEKNSLGSYNVKSRETFGPYVAANGFPSIPYVDSFEYSLQFGGNVQFHCSGKQNVSRSFCVMNLLTKMTYEELYCRQRETPRNMKLIHRERAINVSASYNALARFFRANDNALAECVLNEKSKEKEEKEDTICRTLANLQIRELEENEPTEMFANEPGPKRRPKFKLFYVVGQNNVPLYNTPQVYDDYGGTVNDRFVKVKSDEYRPEEMPRHRKHPEILLGSIIRPKPRIPIFVPVIERPLPNGDRDEMKFDFTQSMFEKRFRKLSKNDDTILSGLPEPLQKQPLPANLKAQKRKLKYLSRKLKCLHMSLEAQNIKLKDALDRKNNDESTAATLDSVIEGGPQFKSLKETISEIQKFYDIKNEFLTKGYFTIHKGKKCIFLD